MSTCLQDSWISGQELLDTISQVKPWGNYFPTKNIKSHQHFVVDALCSGSNQNF